MVLLNEISSLEIIDSSNLVWEDPHDIDSGYSEASGQSCPTSPCPLSPPSSPLLFSDFPQSEGFTCIYYPVVPYYIFPIYPPSEIEIVPESVFLEDPQPASSAVSVSHSAANVNRLIKWTLPPPTVAYFPLPGWEPMPYGMEQFWQSAFAWFFRPLWFGSNHLWTLQPISAPPAEDEWAWHAISYSAKVRFQCQYKHGWTSMKGRVAFWFRMRRHNNTIISEAYFKLYGQQCNRCFKNRQVFLAPLWYHEEIENAVRFLATEVAKTYYGGEKLPVPRRLRQGNPSKDTHHDPIRCQACVEGLCVVRF